MSETSESHSVSINSEEIDWDRAIKNIKVGTVAISVAATLWTGLVAAFITRFFVNEGGMSTTTPQAVSTLILDIIILPTVIGLWIHYFKLKKMLNGNANMYFYYQKNFFSNYKMLIIPLIVVMAVAMSTLQIILQ